MITLAILSFFYPCYSLKKRIYLKTNYTLPIRQKHGGNLSLYSIPHV